MTQPHHDHSHAHAPTRRPLEPYRSPLRASAVARLGFVAALVAGLWALTSWAMT